MNRIIRISQLACCMLAMHLQLNAQNLLSNGDFESGFTGWSKGTAGMSTFSITNTEVYSGISASSVSITGKPTNFWDINLGKGALALTLGQPYTLTFYAKAQTEGAIANVVIQNTKYQAKKFVLNTGWTKYTWIFNPAEVSPNFSFQLGFAENVNNILYLDDVQLTAPTSSASQPFSDSITVNIANKYQVIEGLGGAVAYQEASLFQNYDQNKPNVAAMDSLFSGLRISWIRLFNLWTDSTAWYKNNFKFDSAIIGHAKRRLGYAPKIQITSWSAPAYLKQNNVVNGTNTTNPGVPTLKKNTDGTYKYNEFGQWWLRSVKKYQSFGINPDYISIQNELDYDVTYECTRFDPVENATFAGYGPALNAVYTAIQTLSKKPKIIGPETYGIGGNQVMRYLKPLTNAWQLSGYAYHLYSGNMGDPDAFLPDLSTLSTLLADKPSYQTEFYNESSSTDTQSALHQAWMIHNTFAVGGASAYVHWNPIWGSAPTAFINGDGTNVRQHYFGFKQFSRFIQPGWRMVDGKSNSSYLRSSAYANAKGDSLTVVILNIGTQTGSIKINLGNFITNGGTVYQTNESNLKCIKTGTYTKGGTLNIPGGTITTITFVKNAPPVVSITNPLNNTSFNSPGPVAIAVKATDADGKVKNVRIMDGNVQIASLAGPTFNFNWNVTTLGNHTLTAIATDDAGATTTSAPVIVNIKSSCPSSSGTITASGATTFCQGNSVTLNGISGSTYVWRNGTTQVATTSTYNATVTGSYTVIVTNSNGCKDTSVAKVITVNPTPTATITSPTTSFCLGGNVTLTSSTGSNYIWRNGTTTVGTASTYTASSAGSYTVIISNASGCKDTSAAKVITVNSTPTATISSSSTSFCTGDNLVLSSSAGTSYVWRNGTIAVGAASTYTAKAAGSYTVIVTNSNGCKDTSAVKTITENPLPILTHNTKTDNTSWTQGQSFTACLGDNVYTGPWPNLAAGWSWTGPNSFSSALRSPVITSITSNQAGKYTATYTDPKGCSSSLDLTIIVSVPTATITSPAISFCPGGSVALSANSGTSYVWRNGTTAVGTSSTYTAKTAGSYTVIVSDANGCKDTSVAKAISVNPVPVVSITSPANNAILPTDIFPINATVTGANISNVSFYNGTSLLRTDATSQYSFTTPSLVNGTYTFSAIAKNTSNCTDTAKVTVKVNKVVTGFEENRSENDNLSVSPNPFQHHFIIEKAGHFDYFISDSKGVFVESGKSENTKLLGENLSQGLYIISITNGNITKRISVIKQ